MEGVQAMQKKLNKDELISKLTGVLAHIEAFLAQRKDYLMIVMGGVLHRVLAHCPAEKELYYSV